MVPPPPPPPQVLKKILPDELRFLRIESLLYQKLANNIVPNAGITFAVLFIFGVVLAISSPAKIGDTFLN